jgi:8-oxo-dGTP diphosphatase
MDSFKNPAPAVDAVIFYKSTDNIILIERKNPPLGFALPGGFVNEGESLEDAIKREVKEELSINILVWEQFYTYSDPKRDPRKHVMSTVFIATTTEMPKASDDAKEWYIRDINALISNRDPEILGGLPLVFDHHKIISDVARYTSGDGKRRRLG